MELSEFTFRAFLLFLPGVIATLIIESFCSLKRRSVFYFIVYSFILGFISYFTFGVLLNLAGHVMHVDAEVRFLAAIADQNQEVDVQEVLKVALLAIVLGYLGSVVVNKKYFFRIAQRFGITKKFADIDVWHHVFDSTGPIEWVNIRDLRFDLIYEGWVNAFSDTVEENELFLRDVIVFRNSSGEELYRVPGLYIARKREGITIEFTALEFSNAIEPGASLGETGEILG